MNRRPTNLQPTNRPQKIHPPNRNSGPAGSAEGTRLQKLLADIGLGSRRELEAVIEAGRVSVNGRPAKLGDRARPGDEIRVDGRLVEAGTAEPRAARVLLYHKPVGEIVTRHDPGGRPTVFDGLPVLRAARWMAVGRLDLNTSGLLLFTDSGELAHRLMHPRYGLRREYLARIQGRLNDEQLRRLCEGVPLEDGKARFDSIEPHASSDAANRWYRVTIGEGRNREVRRLFEAAGARVGRLIRLRYGPLALPRELRPGHWVELSRDRVEALLHSASKTARALPE